MTPANITANFNTIPMLNSSNFKSLKENLEIVLGVMDLDLTLREDSPHALTDKSSSEQKREKERWEKSNRMCGMIMRKSIPEAFRGTMSETLTKAKDFLEYIEKRFVKNEKAELGILLTNLISKKYTGKGNIREYIMEISHLVSKLKALKLDLSEDLLVHLVLISLLTQFNQFKVSYNCQKETWSLNEHISHCVQEEERLKQDKTDVPTSPQLQKGKIMARKGKRIMELQIQPHRRNNKKNQMIQRLYVTSVRLKSTLRNTALTFTHGVLRKVCLSCQKPNDVERYIYVGDGKAVLVEAI
ncbi:UNVERIFIED_CONTAM: hypothetical protein Sradi_4854200 [Sesamum radiatum]|uniref:Uncharacterized protein n=1 Tax=Sesamum radiatum TaxID=300843 RepID=A0AAW2MZV2_SESRA